MIAGAWKRGWIGDAQAKTSSMAVLLSLNSPDGAMMKGVDWGADGWNDQQWIAVESHLLVVPERGVTLGGNSPSGLYYTFSTRLCTSAALV